MYSFTFCFVYVFLWLMYPFNYKIRNWLKGQCGNIKKIKELRKNDNSPLVWVHCASLGEFEQGKPLLEAFLKENKGYKSLVTFFSPSGYIPSKKYKADYIAYLPLDTTFNARKFVKAVNPSIVFWVKYDFWKNHLKQIHKRNIPCYLVSATFRPKQIFFKPFPGAANVLRYFNHLFVQTEQSKQLLATVNINNVTVTGDTRFDRVCEIVSQKVSYPVVEQFAQSSDKVLIVGSSWAKDENVIAEALDRNSGIKVILVPHEVEPEWIAESEKIFSSFKTIRYTQANTENVSEYDVLIVDTIGMLSFIYRYAQAAYIGCGFDHGIHNTLEAAVYGIPVTFGPKYNKFIEAEELVALGGATPINNAKELHSLFNIWFDNNAERERQGKICSEYVKKRSGTSSKILAYIKND